MESLLLIVTVVSVALGTAMAFVAWRLLRDNRDRSAARVEALANMAREGSLITPVEPEIVISPAPRRAAIATPVAAPVAHAPQLSAPPVPAIAPPPEPSWDLALRSGISSTHFTASVAHAPTDAAPRRDILREAPAHDLIGSSAMFGADTVPAAPNRRWVALAAVVIVMLVGAAAVYGLRTWDVFGAIANAAAAPRDAQPLELLSLRHATDENGTFTVTGLVQNPHTGRRLRGVVAVVYLFDQQGRFLASGRATLDVSSFSPGDESPFIVKVPATVNVSRYRVGFRLEDGGVVAHIDRRGQVPDGTMEEAIDHGPGTPPLVTPIGPRRSEG
jgi:hypothetical protein